MFVGIVMGNEFLVGEGTDYREMGRDLDGIYILA